MKEKADFKPGDSAFFAEPILREPHKCTILECLTDSASGRQLYKIHDDTQFGTLTVSEGLVFNFEEDVRSALYRENHSKLIELQKGIQTIEDLAAFPLTHCICGEYSDPIARLAYTLKAEEFGLLPETT